MIGSCLRWMIRTENPNERDVHLKAGLEYKLSQHCSSPMNTQHPKGSLWQEWIRSYFTDLQIPDAWGRLWQLWGSPQTYMALQITYQFTQLVKHSLKPQHFAPAKLRHTKQCLPTSSTPSISILNSRGFFQAFFWAFPTPWAIGLKERNFHPSIVRWTPRERGQGCSFPRLNKKTLKNLWVFKARLEMSVIFIKPQQWGKLAPPSSHLFHKLVQNPQHKIGIMMHIISYNDYSSKVVSAFL